jgi:hypothetical protein
LNIIIENVEESNAGRVQVYPNPAGSVLNLIIPQGFRGVRILNATGQVVYDDANASLVQQLDVSQWAAGVYRIETHGLKGATLMIK